MPSVFVSSDELPITVEFLDQGLAKVAEAIEGWCQPEGQIVVFETAAARYVVNFAHLAAVSVSAQLDPASSAKPVVQYRLSPHY
jgi:hypothetical protein